MAKLAIVVCTRLNDRASALLQTLEAAPKLEPRLPADAVSVFRARLKGVAGALRECPAELFEIKAITPAADGAFEVEGGLSGEVLRDGDILLSRAVLAGDLNEVLRHLGISPANAPATDARGASVAPPRLGGESA